MFEYVAHVGEVELLHVGQVGVVGVREVDFWDWVFDWLWVHLLFLVGVVVVGDLECDGFVECVVVVDVGGDLCGVFLDLHLVVVIMAELVVRYVVVDGGEVQFQVCG